MSTNDEYKQIIHAALSTRGYTEAQEFVPRLEGLVPRDLVYPLLKEMAEAGQAELVFGHGWRAVEQEPSRNSEEREVYEAWKREVAEGLTVLSYPEWVHNGAIAAGLRDKEEK